MTTLDMEAVHNLAVTIGFKKRSYTNLYTTLQTRLTESLSVELSRMSRMPWMLDEEKDTETKRRLHNFNILPYAETNRESESGARGSRRSCSERVRRSVAIDFR